MATTVMGLYTAGALMTIACILELAPRASVGGPVPRRNIYAIMGGCLWPILLLGAMQLAALIIYEQRRQHKPMECSQPGVAQVSDATHNPPILRSAIRTE